MRLVLPTPDVGGAVGGVIPAGDPQDSQAKASTLQATAQYLFERRHQRIINNLDVAAGHSGIARKTLKERWHALSECALQLQTRLLDRVTTYVKQMSGVTLRPCCFLEDMAYDETPMRLRLGQADTTSEKLKVFVVQQRWTALVEECREGNALESSFLSLNGAFSPMVRIVDSGKGEGIRNVILSCKHNPPDLLACGWKNLFRIAETDNLSANLRAERLLKATQPEEMKVMQVVSM